MEIAPLCYFDTLDLFFIEKMCTNTYKAYGSLNSFFSSLLREMVKMKRIHNRFIIINNLCDS